MKEAQRFAKWITEGILLQLLDSEDEGNWTLRNADHSLSVDMLNVSENPSEIKSYLILLIIHNNRENVTLLFLE
jgi:hypothetical protein